MASSPKSDEELRRRLLEYGITSPVTSTTRDVLARRLNHAMKRATSHGQRGRRDGRRLNTFSSDEEEEVERPASRRRDEDSTSSRREESFRRQALDGRRSEEAFRRPAPSESRREEESSSCRRSGEESWRSEECFKRPAYFPVIARSGISPRAKIHDDYDTGSDSDPEGVPRGAHRRGGNARRRRAMENGGRDPRVLEGGAPSDPQDTPQGVPHGATPLATPQVLPPQVTQSPQVLPPQANGRHVSEPPPEASSAPESSWHYSVPFLLLVLLAVFFGVVAALYVNMRMPFLPALRAVPAMVQRAIASVPYVAPSAPPGEGAKAPRGQNLPRAQGEDWFCPLDDLVAPRVLGGKRMDAKEHKKRSLKVTWR